jgi:hypothetical protein
VKIQVIGILIKVILSPWIMHMIVENFYASDVFEQLSNLYSIDYHVLLEVFKSFAKHVVLPKEGFIEYVKSMKYPAIKPARIHAPIARPVLKQLKLMILSRLLHFLTKCRRIFLHIYLKQECEKKCEMKPEVSIIKQLNEENP